MNNNYKDNGNDNNSNNEKKKKNISRFSLLEIIQDWLREIRVLVSCALLHEQLLCNGRSLSLFRFDAMYDSFFHFLLFHS